MSVDSRTEVIRRQRAAQRSRDLPVVSMTPMRLRELQRIRDRHPGVTTHAQQQRLIDAMASGGVTVNQAREHLLISNPPNCFMTLPEHVKDRCSRREVVRLDAMGNRRRTVEYAIVDEAADAGALASGA